MTEPIQVERLKREDPFIGSQSDFTEEESQTYITSLDTLVATVVLLLACAGLAVLAHIVV